MDILSSFNNFNSVICNSDELLCCPSPSLPRFILLAAVLYTNSCTRHNYRTTSMQIPCVLSTDFRTTSFGDVSWTVTVMNLRQLPPMLLTSPAQHHGREPPWRMDNFKQQ